MCGRFALEVPWDTVARLLSASPTEGVEWSAAYNIAPTDLAPVARLTPGGERALDVLRWGLVPFWAKDARIGARMINARAETVASKAAFRESFRSRRCLVPASGFYEWTRDGAGNKQPHWIHLPEDQPMVFAGLWASWRGAGADVIRTFSIITVPANDDVLPLHDRMPAVLPTGAHDVWMDPAADQRTLQQLLRPYEGAIAHFKVSREVNHVRSDGARLIAPISAPDDPPDNLELAF